MFQILVEQIEAAKEVPFVSGCPNKDVILTWGQASANT